MYIKGFLKNRSTSIVMLCVVAVLSFGYSTVDAATLQISSASATLVPGDTAVLQVFVNSEGVAVNNAEATIHFPTDLLDVISINKAGSVFSLWVEDPTFSNITGAVTFNGGVPTPGFNGAKGPVISIVVKAKKVGVAEIAFTSAAVRANDGLGTNVLRSNIGRSLTIVSATTPPVVVPFPVGAVSGPAIKIVSTTHPNQNDWYTNTNPLFHWVVPPGSDAVQTSIDPNDSGTPRVTYSPAITEKVIKDVNDGVWYFKLRARSNGVWGPTDTYVVRIDTTPPVIKDTEFSFDDNTKTLTITTDVRDQVSGMDEYKVFINDVLAETVSAKEFVDGTHDIPIAVVGESTVRLVATDRAGNSVESSGSFVSTGLPVPQLDTIPSITQANEQLLIRGTTHLPYQEVTVYIRNNGEFNSVTVAEQGGLITLSTKSGGDRSFFVLTPKLQIGEHDIWVEIGAGDMKASSVNVRTRVTAQSFITIGSMNMGVIPFVTWSILVAVLLIIVAYYVGTRHHVPRSPSIKHVDIAKNNGRRALVALRKRLEKHLDILQETRRSRILTRGEKDLKTALELDLDAVDEALQNQQDT